MGIRWHQITAGEERELTDVSFHIHTTCRKGDLVLNEEAVRTVENAGVRNCRMNAGCLLDINENGPDRSVLERGRKV